eukprot:355302-Chlamydomonas_euryale.AAC.11
MSGRVSVKIAARTPTAMQTTAMQNTAMQNTAMQTTAIQDCWDRPDRTGVHHMGLAWISP